jgi:RNA polymerase sigma-70 factor (ECF subfamily)
MSADPESPEFIEQLRGGDRDAFSRLVETYHRRLVATARTLLNAGDAEDAVQNAWISAYKALPKFEGRSKLQTWLTRIVVNEARMRLRGSGRELTLDVDDDGRDALADRFKDSGGWARPPVRWGVSSPDELLTSDELAECLRKTLAELPEKQRLVLELRDMQGEDFEAICNSLEVSASNVRVLLHRARTRLFALVDHFQETGEC